MNWNLWWVFLTTSLVMDLTPGPAVMMVLSRAIRFGARRSVATICGILSANIVYFAISASSLGALLLSSYRLFFLIKWAGAAYLIFLGVQALWSRGGTLAIESASSAPRSSGRLFLDGFLLQMSNPKAFLYFAAILPQFIDPTRPVAPQIAILGMTNTVLEFGVQFGYASAAGRVSEAARQPRFSRWLDRVSGVFLLGAGGGLAMVRRD
jgi:homoserine/homoserine lactone efflux protein